MDKTVGMFVAAGTDDVYVVNRYVEDGASDSDLRAILFVAAKAGSLCVVEFLLKRGVYPSDSDEQEFWDAIGDKAEVLFRRWQ